MPTSTIPGKLVPVGADLRKFASRFPAVMLNLREEEWSKPLPRTWPNRPDDCFFAPIKSFLKSLKPGDKLIIHFQGFGDDCFWTMVIRLDSLYESSEDNLRLDFERPSGYSSGHAPVNFWAPFILAVAKVTWDFDLKYSFAPDPGAKIFKELCLQFA